MSAEEQNRPKEVKEFVYTWRIENAHSCWQKSGEELVSPSFSVSWLKNSYKLWLYPKGIQGDEKFMSYFIVQRDNDVQITGAGAIFKLYLSAADGSQIHSEVVEGFLSMRKSGMLGYPRFVSWKTLNENKSNYFPDDTLTLCCAISNERASDGRKSVCKDKAFGRTHIRKTEFVKQMPIRCDEKETQKIGEIGSILQDRPIAAFSATFGSISGDRSLAIDIDAEPNEKIKLVTLELMLLDEKRKKVFWEKTYAWHGVIKCENIVVSPHFPKKTDQYASPEMFEETYLFLHCRLAFATGAVTQRTEREDYGTNLNNLLTQGLVASTEEKNPSSCLTASDALKIMHDEHLFYDVTVKTKKSSFKAHEMVLCARSSTFESLVRKKKQSQQTEKDAKEAQPNGVVIQVDDEDDTMRRVIYFLYTDAIEDMHWEVAKTLYKAAAKYNIELLKEKCCAFIKRNLLASNVCEILLFTEEDTDDELKVSAKDFISENDTQVFSSAEWRAFAKSNPSAAVEMMISKYEHK